MAEVWEGRDDVLSRPVAVKVLLPHLAADPAVRERFRREAVTAARLVHPGIVAIFDAGVDAMGGPAAGMGLSGGWSGQDQPSPDPTWPDQASTAFIVMELVPGETLRDLMARQGALPPTAAVAIASQVTDALAHAHAHGLVHRDIKPANVLLRHEGGDVVRVKVADFGIAKVTATAGDLTVDGALLGTPKYISPEQVEGREPDARADLYCLGVVMFEMLAGRPPFEGGSDLATAMAHVQQPAPKLDELRPELPTRLTELVGSLLVKDPASRVGSALALAASLAAVSKQLGMAAAEPGADLHLGLAGARPQGAPVRTASVPAGEQGAQSGPAPVPGPAVPGVAPRVGAVARGKPGLPEVPAGPRSGVDRRQRGPGPRKRRRAGRYTSLVVGALLLAGLSVTLVLMQPGRPPTRSLGGTTGTVSPGTSAVASAPPSAYPALTIVGVRELTQDGNKPNDNVGQLKNVIESGPHPSWESKVYLSPRFGGYGGLGLVLQLDGAHRLHDLVVTSPMDGWSAETFVGTSYSGALSGWGPATAQRSDIKGDATFSLGGRTGRWALLWLTDPGPSRQAVVQAVSVH